MKTLAVIVLLIHNMLTPLANAAIAKHISEHHQQKDYQTHTHHHDHIFTEHDHERTPNNTEEHSHSLVKMEKALFSSSTTLKTQSDFTIGFNKTHKEISQKIVSNTASHIPFDYIPTPPPDTFRNLPLLN